MKNERPDIPLGYTYDAQGNVLTHKNSNGYWYENTRDARGRVLTFKNSDGYWSECTYDAQGRELTYKDGIGKARAAIAKANGE